MTVEEILAAARRQTGLTEIGDPAILEGLEILLQAYEEEAEFTERGSAMAHGALDAREPAALAIADAVWRAELDGLAERAEMLDALPPRTHMRLLWKAIKVAAMAEGALPLPRRADAKAP